MTEKLTIEQAVQKLEQLVKTMETDDLSINDSLVYYEDACILLAKCYKLIEETRGQITDINTRIEDMKRRGEI